MDFLSLHELSFYFGMERIEACTIRGIWWNFLALVPLCIQLVWPEC